MVSTCLVNVLERPHDKSQKEGHANLQSDSTTNITELCLTRSAATKATSSRESALIAVRR